MCKPRRAMVQISGFLWWSSLVKNSALLQGRIDKFSMCQLPDWLGPFRDGVQWSSPCTSSALWTKSLWSLGSPATDRSLARAWQHGSMARTNIVKLNAMRCNGKNHDSMHRLSMARTNWQLSFDGTSQFFRGMALVWARPYWQTSWTCPSES